MEQVFEQKLMQAAQAVEEQVDAELNRLEKLTEEDMEKIRSQRLESLKQEHKKRQEWMANGHGEYEDLPSEKELFDTTKKSERIVCHFYRDSTMRCKIVDKHLDILARKHIEAKFVKLNVDRAPFITERLHIKTLPTIALLIDNIVKDKIIGFTDLGNHDDFSTEMLEWRLGRGGAIDYKGDLSSPPDDNDKKKKINLLGKKPKTIRNGMGGDDDDDDD
ncbi:unnamed protein product [Rotaria socialis]|uniref:Thioredoxin domain-containing protein 9 n=1 Tax=Rotaria socialis TaxID=392032 RepID=A0A820XWI7_9BILA|nr:unnamed protein product [Rotaria socialis]CAF3305151.1 unnamed protein product [Rotaria socialis]CAF3339495.1 unnamed protein product [Rotaria socialis]CAF3421467.1 unnamed protein product [Rotaria socialis]CAF3427173.1 unnamed protein product [Rotaria socialis]